MLNDQNKLQDTLDKQARLMLLGGLFAAGLATPAPALTQTLTVSVNGPGRITSNPPGIDCGLDCTESYALNTTVDLTATATSGSAFYGWGGACSGTINPCTIIMNGSRGATAFFTQVPIVDLAVSPSRLSLLGQRGQAATGQIQVSGGTEPYQVSAGRGGAIVQINSTTFEYRYAIPTTVAIGSTIEDVIRVADATVQSQRIIEVPVTITVQADALTFTFTSACRGSLGDPIPLTGQAAGGVLPYSFSWFPAAVLITNITTQGDQTSAEIRGIQTGSFPVTVQATDASSPPQTVASTVNCAITAASLQIVSFAKTPDGKDAYNIGDSIQFTAEAAQGVAPYRYRWYVSKDGADWSAFGETSESASPPYTFSESGNYQFQVTVTDSAQPTPQTQTSSPLAFTVETLAADGVLRAVSGPENAALDQTVTLSVRFTEGDEPRPNTPVAWTVTTTNGQALPNAVTGRLQDEQTVTNANGIASNRFETGDQPFVYRITAAVNTQSGPRTTTFTLSVGLTALAPDASTPEGAMASYVDRTCANLYQNGARTPEARQLLRRCDQLAQLSDPNDVAYVMDQLTPRNTTEATHLSQTFATQQLRNVLTRLTLLRQGARGASLAGLNLNQDGQTVPLGALSKSFVPQTGGAAGDEPGAELGGRLGIFVDGSINRGDKSRTTQEAGYDYDTYQITAGLDYRFTDVLIAGFALGYSSASSDLKDSGGDTDGSNYTLMGYANYFYTENIFMDGVMLYGRGNFDLQRNIDYFIPDVTREQFVASASPDARQWGASLGTGYDFKLNEQGARASVSGRLTYLKSTLDSYDESGADAFNLQVQENDQKSLTFSLGGEIARAFSLSWGVLTPQLRLDWLHEFEDKAMPISGWLLADPIGGANSFTYQSDQQDANYFLLGAGASAVFSNGVQTFLFYQTTLGKEDYTDYSVTAGLRFEF